MGKGGAAKGIGLGDWFAGPGAEEVRRQVADETGLML